MKLFNDDCLNVLPTIKDGSIDLILTDLPYGMLNCAWDKIINYELLWAQYKRILKPNGSILLFGSGTFSFDLVNSNRSMFKYKYVWLKRGSTNFANAKHRPLAKHEDILVFSNAGCANNSKIKMTYNPQGLVRINKIKKVKKGQRSLFTNKEDGTYIQEFTNYPNDVLLNFDEALSYRKHHPL